jgi:hypothetical protein
MPMPPKPKEGGEDLAEVERALSVLKGRHPEHERTRREDEVARATRKAELDAQAARVAKDSGRKRLRVFAAVAAVVLGAGGGGLALRGEMSRRGAIEQAADAFRAMGFQVLETSGGTAKIETKGDAGCYLAVASRGAESVTLAVTAGDAKASGKGPVLACTCESGRITVEGAVPAGASLVLLRSDAAALGGSRAAAFLPFEPGAVVASDEACAETTLDIWIAAKHAPPAKADEALLKNPAREPLVRTGFDVLAEIDRDLPFGVVDVPAQTCVLVTAPTGPDQPVSLRGKGGAALVGPATGAIGTCVQAATTFTVQLAPRPGVKPKRARASDSDPADLAKRGDTWSRAAVVLAVPAAKVGGLPGLQEAARLARIPLGATTLAAADRAWSAKQVLLAASFPEQLIGLASAPEIAPDPDARIVALSFADANALTSESPDGVFSYCEPSLDDKTLEAICAFSGTQTWHVAGRDAVAGLARAKLPFWLFALQTVSDPVALKVETQMIALSRKLKLEGFEPTTLEAVTETDKGADVLGRTGEDAIVAVSLAPVAPFAFSLTDGPAWALGGPPRVVGTKPMEKVSLTSVTKGLPSAAKDKRRTVVYRRQNLR